MGYSLNRAIPLAIFGFVAGAGLVILLRGLQGMDEIWHPQIGLVIGGIVGGIFFLWGIGALSPEMAAHHVAEPEEDEFGNELPVEDHHHHAEETPRSILGQEIWSITFWTVALFVVLLVFAALPGGFGYTISNDAAANANTNGFFPIDLGNGNTLYVSKLVAFILFAAFTMASLYFASAMIAAGFFGLSRGIREVKAEGNKPLPALMSLGAGSAVAALPSGEAAPAPAAPLVPAQRVSRPVNPGPIGWVVWRVRQLLAFVWAMLLDEPTPAHRRPAGERFRRLAVLLVLMAVLYWVFWEAAIGWIITQPVWLRFVLSISNAILVPLLALRFRWFLHIIGVSARFGARILRALPEFLFQRD